MSVVLSPSHLLFATPSSSLSPLLQRGVTPMGHFFVNWFNLGFSHRVEFFKNYSTISPLQRVQSFQEKADPLQAPLNRLQLQPRVCSCRGSPLGSSLLQATSTCPTVVRPRTTGPTINLLSWSATSMTAELSFDQCHASANPFGAHLAGASSAQFG